MYHEPQKITIGETEFKNMSYELAIVLGRTYHFLSLFDVIYKKIDNYSRIK